LVARSLCGSPVTAQRVLGHGRDTARGAETVSEIAAADGKASFVAADLGDVADVQ
jgi:hypothetical protein